VNRRVVRTCAAALVLVTTGGCAYTQAEADLAAQARRGLGLLREAQAGQADLAKRHAAAQRKRLDEAFDADVRDGRPLSPDWVVEARRGYAAGVDALAAQERSAALNLDADRRNLDAVEDALDKLQWLQSVRQKYLTPDTYLKEAKP